MDAKQWKARPVPVSDCLHSDYINQNNRNLKRLEMIVVQYH